MTRNMKRSLRFRHIPMFAAVAVCTLALAGAESGVSASSDRPLKGSVSTTFTLTPMGFDPQSGVLTASVRVEGVGLLTQLGTVTQTIDQVVLLNLQTLEGPLAGTTVITAANGDQLRGHLTGTTAPTSTPGIASLSGTFVFNGGTGRFSGVSGSAAFNGTATFAVASDPTQGGTGYFTVVGALMDKD